VLEEDFILDAGNEDTCEAIGDVQDESVKAWKQDETKC